MGQETLRFRISPVLALGVSGSSFTRTPKGDSLATSIARLARALPPRHKSRSFPAFSMARVEVGWLDWRGWLTENNAFSPSLGAQGATNFGVLYTL